MYDIHMYLDYVAVACMHDYIQIELQAGILGSRKGLGQVHGGICVYIYIYLGMYSVR